MWLVIGRKIGRVQIAPVLCEMLGANDSTAKKEGRRYEPTDNFSFLTLFGSCARRVPPELRDGQCDVLHRENVLP